GKTGLQPHLFRGNGFRDGGKTVDEPGRPSSERGYGLPRTEARVSLRSRGHYGGIGRMASLARVRGQWKSTGIGPDQTPIEMTGLAWRWFVNSLTANGCFPSITHLERIKERTLRHLRGSTLRRVLRLLGGTRPMALDVFFTWESKHFERDRLAVRC